MQAISKRHRVSFVAIATLLFVFFPSWSNAQSPEDLTSQIQSDGTLLYDDNPPGNNGSGGEFCFTFNSYAGQYPATTTLLSGGGLDCSWYGDPWSAIIADWGNTYISQFDTLYGDGDYWFGVDMGSGTDIDYLYRFQIIDGVYYLGYNSVITNGITSTNVTDNLNTRFLNLGITDGTGTSGNINFSVSYFLDLLEIDPNVSSRNPSSISIEYVKRPDTSFTALGYSILPFTAGSTTMPTRTISLGNGTYDILVRYTNNGVTFGGARPFPQSYIYSSIVVSGGNLTSVGATEYYDGRRSTVDDGYIYRDCSISQFDNCITNAFVYLFQPDPAVISEITNIPDQLSNRFPFAYLSDFQNLITSLFSNPTGTMPTFSVAFAGGTLTLLSAELLSDVPFVPFIRTTVGWLLCKLCLHNV